MQCCPMCRKFFDFEIKHGEVVVCKECIKLLEKHTESLINNLNNK